MTPRRGVPPENPSGRLFHTMARRGAMRRSDSTRSATSESTTPPAITPATARRR
ncbi:MAG: hypothetical protein ACK559_42035 [bacterium]